MWILEGSTFSLVKLCACHDGAKNEISNLGLRSTHPAFLSASTRQAGVSTAIRVEYFLVKDVFC